MGKLFGMLQCVPNAHEFESAFIGLADARHITARHGGRSRARGRFDRGAMIYLALLCVL
jgi:hypothetical protein